MSDADENQPDVDHGEPPFGMQPVPPMIDRTGPPWESTGPTGPRFIETAKAVLLAPTATFQHMRRTGGYGPPLTFGVLGSTIGFAVGMLMQLGFMMITPGASTAKRPEIGMFALMFLLFLPFLLGISLFFWAALYHFILWLLGATREPFETTFRVVSYTYGATSLLQIVPVCGGIIGFVYSAFVSIIGLTQAQDAPTGKATAAVLVPLVLMFVLMLMALAAAVGPHGILPGLGQAA